MTGPECYQEALRLIDSAHEFNIEGDFAANARCFAEAQVLATLALAAATALGRYVPETGFVEADRRAWYVAASEGPGEKQRQREAKAAELAELAEFAAEDRELAQAAGTEKS